MVYRAMTSFSGLISMAMGEEREIPDSPILRDLLKVGYIEAVEPEEEKPKRKRKTPTAE